MRHQSDRAHDDGSLLTEETRCLNAAEKPASEQPKRIDDAHQVTKHLSRNGFVASELYHPKEPNIPIRGQQSRGRSYLNAVRSRPCPTRSNAQLQQQQRKRAQWRPLPLAGKPAPPAGYKTSFNGRCFCCLGSDHKLVACRDPLRSAALPAAATGILPVTALRSGWALTAPRSASARSFQAPVCTPASPSQATLFRRSRADSSSHHCRILRGGGSTKLRQK